LVVEPMANVASAGVTILLPVGSAGDPPDLDGQSTMLSELIFRGAGALDSRAHSDALDRLGMRRFSQVRTHHLQLGATLLGDRMDQALPLLVAMVREPRLPAEAVDPVRSLCIQSLEALDDDPAQLVMLELRRRHLAAPFNRSGYGQRQQLESADHGSLVGAWEARCRPRPSIITAAGAVDTDQLATQLDQLLEGWDGTAPSAQETQPPHRGITHLEQSTAQVHIALAYDAPAEADQDAMLERVAVSVLSGSTSGRLFTEVRQKRSLCYSVGASYRGDRDTGMVSLYAGTTPERAQETLDVCIAQIERMGEGVTQAERDRAVTGLKSHLVMQGESTPARAAAIGQDQFRLGRPRSLEELTDAVDAVTVDRLNQYLAGRVWGQFTLASIGPVPLAVPA
jgi:predicted Zn-dependent peptidase